jgi:hypothetical protein
MYLKDRTDGGDSPQIRIGQLYSALKRYSPQPELYYELDEHGPSIECLVAGDLAAGAWLSGAPEERARQFLLQKSRLFDLPRRKFDALLFLKHVLRSRMGTHCVFGLRANGDEVADNCFVVHLDRENRVVMVSSVYQSDTPEARIEPLEWDAALSEALQEFEGRPISKLRAEPMWVPDWQEQRYVPRLQVKLSFADADLVLLVKSDGEIDRRYTVHAAVSSGQVGLGRVYRDFWSPGEREDGVDQHKAGKTVVLRDLESDSELVGRYVAVQDDVTDDWFPRSFKFLDNPRPTSSRFDRVMVYYHVDLIQRYFRELGLDVLDDYQQFKPMHVVLSPEGRTLYAPNEQRIRIHRLSGDYCITDAREARILYHEFVHAVTDALARLHRQDKTDCSNPRYRQVLQAASLDEGLAYYFACSLAARYGVGRAHFRLLKLDGRTLCWNDDCECRLGPSRRRAYAYNLGIVDEPEQGDLESEIIYDWCEHWGRYLWSLRCRLEAEVADTVIAHSVFFLTRWSTFGMGVLAIMLADRLLFGGSHQETILDAGRDASWKIWDEGNDVALIPPASDTGGVEAGA